jgi:outer membrane receptor protein involved in Fe transport
MKFNRPLWLIAAVLLVSGSIAYAQVTATLNGTVTIDAAPLPGATVTIGSPNMQGTRTTITDVNGNYNFSGIPPGLYTLKFTMEGMNTVTRRVEVGVSQTGRMDASMKLTTVAEAITVTATAPAVLETTEIQSNMQQKMINTLPQRNRSPQGVALLTPGVNATGPRQAIVMSGATADQNLIMVDGAVIQENLRGQQHDLFIEDAIQETTVMTGAVSAEYGRFSGGVINSITKSGGNDFHGSYRDNLSNPAWTQPSEFGEPRAPRTWSQVHEVTVGGRVIRDRLWFFGAGRKTKSTTTSTYASAGGPYQTFPVLTDAKRWEGKLTGQATSKISLVGTYLKSPLTATNNCQLSCLDPTTLDPSISQGNDFASGHLNAVLTNSWLVESLYSRKTFTFIGYGGTNTDPAAGSPLLVYTPAGSSLGYSNAPYFCGICGDETRNNNSWNLKTTYYLATKALGSHSLQAGYEKWAESRFSNNYQSPTNFRINTYSTANKLVRDSSGMPLVIVRGTDPPGTNSWFTWFPILTPSLGSNLRTNSFFVNDKWDFTHHWSFNLGVRHDANNAVDSLHRKTSDDSAFSPRLGVNYDLYGDGRVRLTAGYNVYVGRLAETVNGAGSPAGTPATYTYEYRGPDYASVTTTEAARIMMTWFLANGGTNNTSLIIGTPNIPGAQTVILGSLKSPNVREYTVGGGFQIGSRGFVRTDYIDRNWRDFYVTVANLNTGRVTINNSQYTRNLVENSNALTRTYKAIQTQVSYHLFNQVQLGGNYTYSRLRGNAVQEGTAGGPSSEGGWIFQYPEYNGFTQNNPIGVIGSDQTHKVRAWASYDLATFFGSWNFSAVERFDSGVPYSAVGSIDLRQNANFYGTGKAGGITNPGYASIPTSSTYFFSSRGAYRTAALRATDLAATYSYPIKGIELYGTGYVTNTFNTQKVVNTSSGASSTISTGVRTHLTSGSGLLRFNPMAGDVPKECPASNTAAQCTAMGANFQIPTTFGTPTSKDAYQAPRTYSVAFGVRF